MIPPPLSDSQKAKDLDHLNLLSIFHFVVAGLSLLCILFLFAHYFLMNSLINNPEMWKNGHNAGPMPPKEFMVIMMIGYCIGGVMLILSGVLNALAGYFLRRRKHRIFCLVVAGLDCLQIPFGTILGVFTIIILSRESVRPLFGDMSSG